MQVKTIDFLWAVIISLAIPLGAQAVSINERAGNNFRTAANNQEFTLNKNNVNSGQFGLLHVHDFNAKVETATFSSGERRRWRRFGHYHHDAQ